MEDFSQSVEKQLKRIPRWYEPSPGRLFLLLLPLLGTLLLLNRLQWISPLWAGLIAASSLFFVMCFSLFWYSAILLNYWRIPPGCLIFGSFFVTAILFLLNWLHCSPKGCTVLFVNVSVSVVVLFLPFWHLFSILHHQRLRYSIWSIPLLILSVAISVSWLVVEIKQANVRGESVRALTKKKAEVEYYLPSFMEEGPHVFHPLAPTWLLRLLGEDFFGDVYSLHFERIDLTAVDWENIKPLKELNYLRLQECTFMVSNLKQLNQMKHLRYLILAKINLTDTNLEYLRGLTQVDALMLTSNSITDAGLEQLKGLKQLKELSVRYNRVTDEGITELQKDMPNTHMYW